MDIKTSMGKYKYKRNTAELTALTELLHPFSGNIRSNAGILSTNFRFHLPLKQQTHKMNAKMLTDVSIFRHGN